MGYQVRTRDEHFQNDGTPKRILALDGGGLRGILTLGFLGRIEALLRDRHGAGEEFRLAHYFDLIAGTSTGAIIAAALASGWTVAELEKSYLELGRKVAIKFLPDATAKSPRTLERFKREARAASAHDHPHICVVFDVGTHEVQPFLVMERLRGRTLDHAIGGKPLPVDRVLSLGEQIADALDAAHRAGIVHRDLKPANLFVTERGDAKIVDFGLAKVGTSASGSAIDAAAATVAGEYLTEAGTTLGTVAYM